MVPEGVGTSSTKRYGAGELLIPARDDHQILMTVPRLAEQAQNIYSHKLQKARRREQLQPFALSPELFALYCTRFASMHGTSKAMEDLYESRCSI